MDIVDKLLSRIKVDERGCFNWQGATCGDGYGQTSFGGCRWIAHRLSYATFRGAIPEGVMVCHECDNPRCINPAHLFIGTNHDNMVDAVVKRRLPSVKLQESEVIWAVGEYRKGRPAAEIGAVLGVDRKTIRDAAQGKTWVHVVSAMT